MTTRGEITIIVAVFAVPAAVLLPPIHMNTPFTASLRTINVQFTTAPWKSSAGLFSFDDVPLRLTIDDFDRMEFSDPSNPSVFKSDAPVSLIGARLNKLDMTQPNRVLLETGGDGDLSMTVERLGPDNNEVAIIRVDAASQLPIGMAACKSKWSCEWAVYGKSNRLHLTLKPLKGLLRPESNIPLSDGSAVTFNRENGAFAIDPAGTQMTALDRKLSLRQPVEFDGLKGTTIESLTPDAQGIKMVITDGSSGQILLGGSNEAATLAQYLYSQKPLTASLSMVALIGSTILTILTRLKLIKSKD